MEPTYEDVLDDTIWSHFAEMLRLESAVRRLLVAAEQCQDELQATRRGVMETQQAAPPAAQSRMI